MNIYDIILTIEKLENEEKLFCEHYCELNPGDTARRKRDKHLVLAAYARIKTELKKGAIA